MSNEERRIHVTSSCAWPCTELKQGLLLIQSLRNGGRAAFDGKETEAWEIRLRSTKVSWELSKKPLKQQLWCWAQTNPAVTGLKWSAPIFSRALT